MIPTQQDIAEFTRFQRNEITESILYERLASIEKDENNRKTLRLIAAEEKSHYAILKKYTGKEIGPDYKRIARFILSGTHTRYHIRHQINGVQ